ncbi:MAG: IclR family transcriptional regulator [Treponema sp.]|jgi:DNA-binding IclR family transcriptional regulator|nr:IclR family transcriptional regulator [Treponema sp.]
MKQISEALRPKERRIDFTPQTFRKALMILESFTMEQPEHTAKDLGYLFRLSQSSLYRYLSILEEGGYLVKDQSTGCYTIGLHILELGGVALSKMTYRRHGQPALDRISAELNTNANMGVFYKGDLLHIGFAVWLTGEPNYSVIGRKTPINITAMGKVILSSLEFQDVKDIINRYGWRPRTKNSITNFKDLEKELQKIRGQGYAVDNQECGDDCCLAFPVLDQRGFVVAAMSATTSVERFGKEFDLILKCVKKHAEEVTYRMGYNGLYPVIRVRNIEDTEWSAYQ